MIPGQSEGDKEPPQVVASQLLSSSLGILGVAVTSVSLGAFRKTFPWSDPCQRQGKILG